MCNHSGRVFRCLGAVEFVFVWWCLTPLSTIFQLYRGDQFYLWRKPEDPEKIQRPFARHWESLSHIVVHLALIEVRTHNVSGDRYWLHIDRCKSSYHTITATTIPIDNVYTTPVKHNMRVPNCSLFCNLIYPFLIVFLSGICFLIIKFTLIRVYYFHYRHIYKFYRCIYKSLNGESLVLFCSEGTPNEIDDNC